MNRNYFIKVFNLGLFGPYSLKEVIKEKKDFDALGERSTILKLIVHVEWKEVK